MERYLSVVHFSAGVMLALACVSIGGCASTGKKTAKENPAAATTNEEYEAQLRKIVEDELSRERRRQGAENVRFVSKKPFYYKEYFEFPDDPKVRSLDFTEKESRAIPLTAELQVEKVRFSTRVNKDKEQARNDDNFLRSTGIDYTSYELRTGEWHKLGDMFLAEKNEENSGGEWKPVLERRRVVAPEDEEKKPWYQKLMFWR